MEIQIKKNIMYIFNDTGFGGAGQSLLDTLVEIKDEINPIVVIQDDGIMVESKFIELDIRYYKIRFSTDYVKIGSADAEQKMRDIGQSYEAALQLLPIIKKENIQLVHINSSVSSFAAMAALIAHVPYIWHVRELLEDHYGCEFLNEELKISLYKKANKLIAISDYVKKRYCEKYGLETFTLYNGINSKRFRRNITERNEFENTFIVAARITPEKGQWDVIQATDILVKKGYGDIKVIIVGDGGAGYIWALKKYIIQKNLENNICILPFQDDLSQLRCKASYAITSSQNEALGRVTIEAMLAGNVVIGARSGGTTEIIGENEERGFLYGLGNCNLLADAMERAMNYDNKEKKVILQKAQQFAERTFNSKQYCKELMRIYNDTIAFFKPYEHSEFLNSLKEYYDSIKDYKNSETKDKTSSYRKSELMLQTVSKWLEIKKRGHSLDEYFKKNRIQNIAIYGMGALGCRLYDELENSGIEIKHLIDRDPNGMDKVLKFSLLDKEKLDVDMIVVTVISSEKQIIDGIKTYGYEKIIGLSAILSSFDDV